MGIRELVLRLERLQGSDPYVGKDKRKFVRLLYPPLIRPMFKIGKFEVEVVDISERGIKLYNYMQHAFGPTIQGTIVFHSGISYEISGKVVWQVSKEIGLLSNRIPLFIIEEEIDYLLRYYQKMARSRTQNRASYSLHGAF